MRVRLAAEPSLIVRRPQDRRHAIVNPRDHLVRRHGDDRKRRDPLAGRWILPILPQAGETKRRPVLHPNGIGLLAAPGRLPFKETVHRHDTVALRYASRNIGSERKPQHPGSPAKVMEVV